jgi:SAM-dependent methyltransferase
VSDPRDEFLSQVVHGKSFADVGGLWGTVNEKVSVAQQHGATALTMIDVLPSTDEEWRLFEVRRRDLGLPPVNCISADVVSLVESNSCPQFDVVHCSGVLYHMPDPLRFLEALRKITREYLILGSVVSATKVESAEGVLHLPKAAALFIPALRERERSILTSYWRRLVGDQAVGLTGREPSWRLDDFSPWWWLPTVDAFKAMCTVTGFRCHKGAHFWHENAYVMLLSVR